MISIGSSNTQCPPQGTVVSAVLCWEVMITLEHFLGSCLRCLPSSSPRFFCPLRVATTQSMQINTTRARPHYYLSKCLFSVLFSALPKAADWRRSVHVSRHWPPRRVNIDRNNHLQWALLFMIALYTELLLLLLVLVVAMIMLSASFFPHQIQILT